MQSIRIQDGKNFIQKEVRITGWVFNVRSSGSIIFIELRDGSGFMQAVVTKDDVHLDCWETAAKLGQESSVSVSGIINKHPKKEDVFELRVQHIEVIQLVENYPIAKKEHGPEFLLDNRHLWLRSKKQWAIQRIRDVVIAAIYDFLRKEGFIKIDTPIITPNACEGATDLFEIEYFDQGKVFLSQSGQLYLEAAIMSVGRAFDFGPVFRAERSKTRRHLAEFWMMDAEAAFVEHEENMVIQEKLLSYIVRECLTKCGSELIILERNTEKLKKIKPPFTRVTYTEALERLHELGSDIKFGDDLGNDDEGLLTKDSDVPIFIQKWPRSIKPFYMKVDPDNTDLVLNNDLIGIEEAGELAGGSQREDSFDILKKAIQKEGLSGPEYEWYLDLRKYGSVPHSGFGFGLERIVRWISGAKHVRETIPFPRMVQRVRP